MGIWARLNNKITQTQISPIDCKAQRTKYKKRTLTIYNRCYWKKGKKNNGHTTVLQVNLMQSKKLIESKYIKRKKKFWLKYAGKKQIQIQRHWTKICNLKKRETEGKSSYPNLSVCSLSLLAKYSTVGSGRKLCKSVLQQKVGQRRIFKIQ